MMKRREFITLLGGAAAAWPLGARAAADGPVIGFLGAGAPAESSLPVTSFRHGLFEADYIDAVLARELTARGKRYAAVDVTIAFRWANSAQAVDNSCENTNIRRPSETSGASVFKELSVGKQTAGTRRYTLPLRFPDRDMGKCYHGFP